MTGIAGLCCRNVGCRIFTGGNHIVMTAFTGTDYFVVIDNSRWRPGVFCMAGFTYIRGVNVGSALANGMRVVVTRRTGFGCC